MTMFDFPGTDSPNGFFRMMLHLARNFETHTNTYTHAYTYTYAYTYADTYTLHGFRPGRRRPPVYMHMYMFLF